MQISEDKLLASICRDSFYDFLVEFWPVIVPEPFIPNWHIKAICDELQVMAEQVFAGEPRRYDLVINVPPGTTKSTIVSQAFPAWCWTRMPAAKFICASYAYQVALKDSLKTRDLVQSEKFRRTFPGILLREDENTKGLFTNTRMGFRLSVGVGGLMTGFHAHFLIVDDPINPEGAYSEAELRAVNRWMATSLPSRKVDQRVSPLILIQQRLHLHDPSGEILGQRAERPIRHICLPGELSPAVSPPEWAARYQGGLLDPVRFPRGVLERMRREMGEYGYSAQVLQQPVPLGGGMFQVEKILLERVAPPMSRMVRSWDKAGTEGGGAYSAGVKMGIDSQGRFWVLDVVRGQWGSAKREEMILQTARSDGEDVPVLVEVEGGSGGKESGEMTARNLAGFRVLLYHPTGDKVARAYPFSSQVGAGSVSVLKREWTGEFLDELRLFPQGRYKDQVDAASAAFSFLVKKRLKVGAAW